MLGTGLNISPTLLPIFRACVGNRGPCPHFIDVETEAQKMEAACPRAHRGSTPPRPHCIHVCTPLPLKGVTATVGGGSREGEMTNVDPKRVWNKKTINPIIKWTKDLKSYFSKEDLQMVTNQNMKGCSTLVISQMQVKTTTRYHFTHPRVAKIFKKENNKCCQGCEYGTFAHCYWECKMAKLPWESLVVPQKV